WTRRRTCTGLCFLDFSEKQTTVTKSNRDLFAQRGFRFGRLRRYSSRQILSSISNTHGSPALTTLPTRLRSFLPSLTRSSSDSVRTWSRYSSSSNSRKAIGLFMISLSGGNGKSLLKENSRLWRRAEGAKITFQRIDLHHSQAVCFRPHAVRCVVPR